MPDISQDIDKTLAVLLGLLYTDGCVSRKGKNSWRMYFSNKSEVLVTVFRTSIIEVFQLPQERVRIDTTKDGLLRAIVDSREVGDQLTEAFGTFRTLQYNDGSLPTASLPVARLIQADCVGPFLQAAFSCDGGVHLYVARRDGPKGGTTWLIRGVYLACAHPVLRKQYQDLLSSLGIRSREVVQDGKIKIETHDDIRRFQKLVNFVPKATITHSSKFWEGYEKCQILELLVGSYKQPSSIYTLPMFNRTSEIMR